MAVQTFLLIIKCFYFQYALKSNYPAKKSISDLDVELDDNLEDGQYIKILDFY